MCKAISIEKKASHANAYIHASLLNIYLNTYVWNIYLFILFTNKIFIYTWKYSLLIIYTTGIDLFAIWACYSESDHKLMHYTFKNKLVKLTLFFMFVTILTNMLIKLCMSVKSLTTIWIYKYWLLMNSLLTFHDLIVEHADNQYMKRMAYEIRIIK